jgi:hypothetical protein
MIKFNKSTLTEIAGLGAGAVAGAYVSQKVLTKADGTYLVGSGTTGKLVADLAPIVVGLALQGQSNLFAKEAGKGMIAQAAGSFIKSKVPALGITGDGYSDNVMMAGTLDTGVDNPMISAVPNDYLNDDNAGDAGEMDY